MIYDRIKFLANKRKIYLNQVEEELTKFSEMLKNSIKMKKIQK